MPEAILVLGGEAPSVELLRYHAGRAPVYAADGGAKVCLRSGVRPEFVVGDMDSANAEALPVDWDVRLRLDQDFTDFEKVLAELPGDVEAITILGGFGGRLDHQWNNYLIAAEIASRVRVRIVADDTWLDRVTSACSWYSQAEPGGVSLLPVGVAEGVRTSGLRWNLDGGCLGSKHGISQSNEVIGPATVSVERGVLFVCGIEPAR